MYKNLKVLGGFLAAAIGDAMGAATETRNQEQIREYFEGRVTDLRDIPDDVPSRGWEKGSVTDGFSLAYCTALTLIERNGEVDEEAAEDVI
ncbi:MAG: ADP-ribosylglycohydrolase family protein, partial [Erysipelotrichaceae bacterium]|nr:ADP-ribosylglycohydrolase family protein [Erysipelotrichaceae bacterium]